MEFDEALHNNRDQNVDVHKGEGDNLGLTFHGGDN